MNLLSDLYIHPSLGKSFKFMVFRLLENAFASQNIECRDFHLCSLSRQNSPPSSYNHPRFDYNSIYNTLLNANNLKWSKLTTKELTTKQISMCKVMFFMKCGH